MEIPYKPRIHICPLGTIIAVSPMNFPEWKRVDQMLKPPTGIATIWMDANGKVCQSLRIQLRIGRPTVASRNQAAVNGFVLFLMQVLM